jgi:hypothetical protein
MKELKEPFLAKYGIHLVVVVFGVIMAILTAVCLIFDIRF